MHPIWFIYIFYRKFIYILKTPFEKALSLINKKEKRGGSSLAYKQHISVYQLVNVYTIGTVCIYKDINNKNIEI
jgi:hypothetical protein